MDWYYPVLGGAVRGEAGRGAARRAGGTRSWSPGSASAASSRNPWVTGAETCELVLALDALGDRDARRSGCSPTCSTCATTTAPTGPATCYPENVNWPDERTTYTAAAMILAADALSLTTPGADDHARHDPAAVREIGLECGCASADRLSGRS